MKPATASVRPEGISIRFRPEDTWLNSPFAPEKSPLSALSRRSFMKNAELEAPRSRLFGVVDICALGVRERSWPHIS